MKKLPLDYLLIVARMFLLLMFLAILVTAIVGYCVLPDQIISRAYSEYDFHPRNPYSKEYFLGVFVGLAFFFALFGFFSPFFARKPKPGRSNGYWSLSDDYWNHEENFVLKEKMIDFWFVFTCGTTLLFFAVVLIRHFPVNLSVSQNGSANTIFDILVVPLIYIMSRTFCFLTLAVVKWYRIRNTMKKA